jgi:hypothetical protein
VIVITGPGRSGTSFLARLYLELGFDPGGAWDGKIRAGFEEAETVALNTEICGALQAPMGNPPSAPLGSQRWDLVGDLAKQHRSRLHEIAEKHEVVKDPRFCWTLGVWLEAGVPIEHVVLAFRRVDDVIESAGHAGMVAMPGSEQERNLMRSVRVYRMGSLVTTVGDYDVANTILWFPKFLSEPDHVYDSLRFPKPVDRASFLLAFERTLDRDLVHFDSR